MVRKIDASAPLTREEFRYLRDRNRLPVGYTIDDEDDTFTEDELKYAERDAKRHEAVLRRRAARRGNFAPARRPQPQPDPDEDPEDSDEGYDGWSKDELQEELENRGLKKSGKVADLVARLEADDAEDE